MALSDALDSVERKECKVIVDVFGTFYRDIVHTISKGKTWVDFARIVRSQLGSVGILS